MQMLTEWLAKTYPQERVMTRVRLGYPRSEIPSSYMSPEERAMIGAWRRWADAIILQKDKLTLVESAIRPDPGKVGQLQLYKLLVPNTPELEPWKGLPIEMILLYAIEDPATNYMARAQGIHCIEYKPLWLPDYLTILSPRERRGSQFTTPTP
jgi:hypothetical protein